MDDKRALRSQIKKEIELLDAEQRRIDNKYQSASKPPDARYERESGSIRARKEDAWTRLHAITGIHTLPDELLLDMMQLVVWQLRGPPYNPHIRLRQLQYVCKHWMALCLGTASFWTKFDLPLPSTRHDNIGLHVARLENGFSQALTRSKGLPISLSVSHSNVDYCPTILRKIFKIIRPSQHHVQSLTLNLTADVVMMVADTLGKQFSRLEELILRGHIYPGSWRFPLALRTTILKRLHVMHDLHILVLDPASSLFGLEVLHLHGSTLLEGRRAAEESVEEWICRNGKYQERGDFVLDTAVLQKLPNLRSLFCRHVQLKTTVFPSSDSVYLRELRALSVAFWVRHTRTVEMEVAPFFQHVQLPKLQSLRVESDEETDSDTADRMIDTLHPVMAGITSIVLHRIIPSAAHLKMLLLRANDLEELDIGGGEISIELMRVLDDPMLKHLRTIKFTDIKERSFAIFKQMLSQPTEEAKELSRRVRIQVQKGYMANATLTMGGVAFRSRG
ncbi:hypothetical protein CALVIDRAFT_535277 [Calocera viscosa TUFC12733]|uniref:F-box domain-containing protein n=1 Tax=Calocera viscosa (strain TUFC12733) TaxID=1330018 RepID=A0A167PDJ6_CALVF|nr:hypothetical protein CALVIDRAFT_535277 [Calocera viscosa TUFC12733]